MSSAGATVRHPEECLGDLLVTGCPRSGTKYAARLLTALGRPIGHEQLERDGISSWCMAVAADEAPWGPARRAHQTFACIFHQVRNPRLVIPSMSTLRAESWAFIAAHVPSDPAEPALLRRARFWYQWNRYAERIAHWRYRLEDLPVIFPKFCERAQVACDPAVLERVGTDTNSRAYPGLAGALKRACERVGLDLPSFARKTFADRRLYDEGEKFSWPLLKSMDGNVHDQVISLATEYGYTTEDLRCT